MINFVRLSQEGITSTVNILKYNNSLYPRPNQFETGTTLVSINGNNGNYDIRIVFKIDDKIGLNGKMALFNNDFSKKYLKAKLFEINSLEMQEQISLAGNNIARVEQLIKSFNAYSKDFSPSYEFEKIGSLQGLLADGTFYYTKPFPNFPYRWMNYFYDKSLKINGDLNFLSIGLIFYIDFDSYFKEQKTEKPAFYDNLASEKAEIIKIIDNKTVRTNTRFAIHDLRLIKSAFQGNTQVDLDNLLYTISSDKSLNKLATTNRYLQNNSVSVNSEQLLEMLDLKKSIIQGATPKVTKLFSNAYFARNNTDSNLFGFNFSFNYKEILSLNSVYENYLRFSSLKEAIMARYKISSLKILRREMKKKNENDFTPIENAEKVIAVSDELGKNGFKKYEDEKNFISLEEIKLNTDRPLSENRSFAVKDNTAFFNKKGYYQYGVEISISNTINNLLSSVTASMNEDIKNLNEYLGETTKIVTSFNAQTGKPFEADRGTVFSFSPVTTQIRGNYDPQSNSFTPEFVRKFDFQTQNRLNAISTVDINILNRVIALSRTSTSSLSLKEKLVLAATRFSLYLKLFGVGTSDLTSDKIINLLHPRYTNAETIQNFINIYEKFSTQVNKIVKNNADATFTVQHWFKEILDTNISTDLGYSFLFSNNYAGLEYGLAAIDLQNFYNRINLEINRFSSLTQPPFSTYGDKQFSYLTPNVIYSKTEKLDLSALDNLTTTDNQANFVPNKKFTDVLLDVKNTVINHFSPVPTVLSLSDKSVPNYKTQDLLKKFSIVVDNYFIEQNEESSITREPIKNDKVNENGLLTLLLNQFDTKTNLFFKEKNSLNNLTLKELQQKNETAFSFTEQSRKELPIHLNLLIDDRCSLLEAEDNYKKDLVLNSKFNLLFNTIHSIEVLSYTDEFFNEKWSLLDSGILDGINSNDGFYLCRLKSYKNSTFDIDGTKDINLPVYNEYFLLTRNQDGSVAAFDFSASLRTIAEENAILEAERLAREEAERLARLAEEERLRLEKEQIAARQVKEDIKLDLKYGGEIEFVNDRPLFDRNQFAETFPDFDANLTAGTFTTTFTSGPALTDTSVTNTTFGDTGVITSEPSTGGTSGGTTGIGGGTTVGGGNTGGTIDAGGSLGGSVPLLGGTTTGTSTGVIQLPEVDLGIAGSTGGGGSLLGGFGGSFGGGFGGGAPFGRRFP